MTAMQQIKEKISDLKKTSSDIEREIREKTVGYIVAGLSVVAGLAWNEAIKSFIEEFFPLSSDTVKAKFIYALVVTSAIAVVSFYLVRIFRTGKGSGEKGEGSGEAKSGKSASKNKKK